MSKIILITGASTGLGASLAIQAAQQGHSVYATMRDPRKGTALSAAVATENLHLMALDVQDQQQVDLVTQEIIVREGRIDVLVNNAGSGFARATEQARWGDIAWINDVNFLGVVRMTKAVLPHMRKARSGHVINISSVGGLVGQPFNEIYCATKFAVEGYTEALASYVTQAFGIHFTAVEPGGMHSEFAASALRQIAETGGLLDDEYRPILQAYMARAQQRGTSSFQTPEEVAAQIVALIGQANPPIRMRTSAWGDQLCDLKTQADPDGKAMQQRVHDIFLGA